MYVVLRFLIVHGLSDQINEVIKDISMLTDDTFSQVQIDSQKVPHKPVYINFGLPKSGSTSLHHYFKCGGKSHPIRCVEICSAQNACKVQLHRHYVVAATMMRGCNWIVN